MKFCCDPTLQKITGDEPLSLAALVDSAYYIGGTVDRVPEGAARDHIGN